MWDPEIGYENMKIVAGVKEPAKRKELGRRPSKRDRARIWSNRLSVRANRNLF